MSLRLVVFLSAMALVFSGCTDAPDDDDVRTDAGGQTTDAAAPEWTIGNYWTYESPNGTTSLVVTGEEGGDWILESDDAELALIDTQSDLSWMGAIRKSDLAGSQGSQRIKFFDFPLEDSKEWTTTWDGESVNIVASFEEEGRYRMEAQMGGEPYADYVYDAQVGYFEKITWIGIMDGQDWGLSLTDSGQEFSGTIHRYEIGQTHTFVNGADGSGYEEVEISEQWNELQFVTLLLCNDDPAGVIAVGVNSPAAAEDPLPMVPTVNEPEDGNTIDCMEDPIGHRVWLDDNPGGVWEIGMAVTAPNGVAHLFITERAHHEVPFPE